MFDPARRVAARALRATQRALGRLAWRVDVPRPRFSAADLRYIGQNRALAGLHEGRPAFVLGNGPSLQNVDLHPLADEITFVANGFWRHPILNGPLPTWQPRYYSIIDPLYFDGSAAVARWYRSLRARVMESTFLVPVHGAKTIHDQGLLPRKQVRVCGFRGSLEFRSDCPYDLAAPLPHLQGVLLLSLLAALYTGCKPIYILGADHDWLASPSVRYAHFYPGVSIEDHVECNAIERGRADDYLTVADCLVRMYRVYYRIRDLATEMGAPIYNATDGGYLDVFPRVPFDEAVRGLGSAKRPRSGSGLACVSA